MRRSLVRAARERLAGEIEIDETHVRGAEEAKRGREAENKAIVVSTFRFTRRRSQPRGLLSHRLAQQAAALRGAIVDCRKVKQLLRDWETEIERLTDAENAVQD